MILVEVTGTCDEIVRSFDEVASLVVKLASLRLTQGILRILK